MSFSVGDYEHRDLKLGLLGGAAALAVGGVGYGLSRVEDFFRAADKHARVVSMVKRKHTRGWKGEGVKKRARTVAAARRIVRAAVVPGITRMVGNYGRYQGLGQEKKFHDLAIDDAVITAALVIQKDSLNLIAQGTSES